MSCIDKELELSLKLLIISTNFRWPQEISKKRFKFFCGFFFVIGDKTWHIIFLLLTQFPKIRHSLKCGLDLRCSDNIYSQLLTLDIYVFVTKRYQWIKLPHQIHQIYWLHWRPQGDFFLPKYEKFKNTCQVVAARSTLISVKV